MSTAYSRHLGTERHLHANGRVWTVEKIGGLRTVAEVRRFEHGNNPHSYVHFPRGLGFGALEVAGHWRRRAMTPRLLSDHRIIFKRRCWEGIEQSRKMRMTRDLAAEAREVREMSYLIAAE